jgi:hypothetical protein
MILLNWHIYWSQGMNKKTEIIALASPRIYNALVANIRY